MKSWLSAGWPHIWLPYTQMKDCDMPLAVTRAEGNYIHLSDGRKILDGIASWWSMCHGYQHPEIVRAIQEQAAKLSHVMFAGLAHEPAYTLAKRLVEIAPVGLARVFFSDSGSTAVEVAMKMAVQYWKNKGVRGRRKFICFRNGYHGDTMGAMSLSDPQHGMHAVFHRYMPEQYVVDIPRDEYALAELTEIFDSGIHETSAAVIIEPLVQGAGGMKFYSADILAEIYRLCKTHDLLFIADEIMTGFGRTGSMFACDEAGITPDILCLGKGLTGGHISLAATLATENVFKAFASDELEHALMHGPTFMANPLACAAANTSLDIFSREPRLEQVDRIEQYFHQYLACYRNHNNVRNVRVKGAIGVVELKQCSWTHIQKMRRQLLAQNIWLRPFGNVIYLMPSFTITEEDAEILCKSIMDILEG